MEFKLYQAGAKVSVLQGGEMRDEPICSFGMDREVRGWTVMRSFFEVGIKETVTYEDA